MTGAGADQAPWWRDAGAGYDVTDHRDVAPMFGTLDDFDELVRDARGPGKGYPRISVT